MNARQLRKLGIPEACLGEAIVAAQLAAKEGLRGAEFKRCLATLLEDPATYVDSPALGALARAVEEDRSFVRPEPIDYRTWGSDIDDAAHAQMRQACSVPMAASAALMPDAHVGYGLPIGGVLALEGAVIPYAVGVDIACRMKLSVLDLAPSTLDSQFHECCQALEQGTRFGIGSQHEKRQEHDVMDADWSVSRITREKKDTAWKQLGTSGSGNHFVEFGTLTVGEPVDDDSQPGEPDLPLAPGKYVALLSHSGSRGTGAAVCSTYSGIARRLLPHKYQDLGRLAWLSLDSQEGQDYWAAMNLMGEYAAANHEVIHRLVTRLIGADVIAGVENHHNFAWREIHQGRELVVHRKGATPAAAGELGVIPGSMGTPAFVVRGKGQDASLRSASHGAGRRMSRRKAKDTYRWKAVRNDLKKKGVHVLSAGADESPGVYKDILSVMREQSDLVETLARFDPRIVKMCDDGSQPED